jgi:aminoacylase
MQGLGKHLLLPVLLLLCSSVLQVALCGSLEDDPAIQRFREYLQIPTVQPSVDYEPAMEFLLGQAEEIGLGTTRIELVKKKPILVLTWKGSEPSLTSILLNSHMDVVPVDLEKWEHDPFAADMDEAGNIYARGTQDMKGMGMHYLEAIRLLKQKSFEPVRTIHVIFVPDEEIGGDDGWKVFINSAEFASLNVGIALDEGGLTIMQILNLSVLISQ